MLGEMNIINDENLVKAFEAISCGKAHVVQISAEDFEVKHIETCR